MKARQDFELIIDEDGNRLARPYLDGEDTKVTKILVKKGEEIPKKYEKSLLSTNPDFFELDGHTEPETPAAVELPTKLSESDFLALTRKEQEDLLNQLKIKFSKKDKETDLFKKYQGN